MPTGHVRRTASPSLLPAGAPGASSHPNVLWLVNYSQEDAAIWFASNHRSALQLVTESGPISLRGARDPDLSTTLLCAVYIFIMKVTVTTVDKYAVIV